MKFPTRKFEVVPLADVLRTARPIEDDGPTVDFSGAGASLLPTASETLPVPGNGKDGEK